MEREAVAALHRTSPTRWRCTTTARSRRCFARMARIEAQARRRRSWPRWAGPSSPARRRRAASPVGRDGPGDAFPSDDVHYLMQPWHALQLALAAEQRAEAFFAELAATRAERGGARRRAASCATRSASTSRWSRPGSRRCRSPAATGPTTRIRRATPIEPSDQDAMQVLLPEGWSPPVGYANGIAVDAGRLVFIAGQVGWDAQQRFESRGARAAVRAGARATCSRCWREAGGEPHHICRMTAYCCDKPAYLAARARARRDLAPPHGRPLPGDEHDLRRRPARPPGQDRARGDRGAAARRLKTVTAESRAAPRCSACTHARPAGLAASRPLGLALDQAEHRRDRDRAEGRPGVLVDLGEHGVERPLDRRVDDAPAGRGAMSSKRWMTSISVSRRALPAKR